MGNSGEIHQCGMIIKLQTMYQCQTSEFKRRGAVQCAWIFHSFDYPRLVKTWPAEREVCVQSVRARSHDTQRVCVIGRFSVW